MQRDMIDRDLSALTGAFERALAPIPDEDLDLVAGNLEVLDSRFLETLGIAPEDTPEPFEDWDGVHHS